MGHISVWHLSNKVSVWQYITLLSLFLSNAKTHLVASHAKNNIISTKVQNKQTSSVNYLSADLWHVRCLWDSSLTSPTMAGSKVGSWYTARSLVFSAPVANRVWEGFKAILWIPQGHSAGILFLLLFREGMWNCFPVLVSRTISWNWVGNLMELRQIFYQQNKFLHTIHISFTIPCYI